MGYAKNDTAQIKTLGVSDSNFKAKNWFYNIAPIYKVKNISLIDSADWTYQLELNVDHCFRVGDYASVILDGNASENSTVIKIVSSKKVEIKGQGRLIDQPSNTYELKRLILKTQSNNFPKSTIYSTNVQNVYKKGDDYLIASGSNRLVTP